MKIAVACVNLVPENVRRQPWYYLNAVAEGLMAAGHEVWVLTDKEGDWADGRPTLFIPSFRSFPRGIDAGVGPRLAREGFDLIFWSTGLTDFFFQQGLKTLKIQVVAAITSPRYTTGELLGWGFDLSLNWGMVNQFLLSPFISRARVRRFLEQPNLKALLFQCQGTMSRYLPRPADQKKAMVLRPPLPQDFLRRVTQSGEEQEKRELDCFKILYFGPPISIRGVDTLIDAMAQVGESIGNARLEILSRLEHKSLLGHEERMRNRIHRLGLSRQVEVVSGVLSPQEMAKRLLSADVICLPFKGVVSDVPLAVLEAIATGTPVVTTEVAGVTEFAQNGRCQIVPPGDVKSLAKAILMIYQGRNAQKRSEDDLNIFINRHSQAAFVSSLKQLLQEIA